MRTRNQAASAHRRRNAGQIIILRFLIGRAVAGCKHHHVERRIHRTIALNNEAFASDTAQPENHFATDLNGHIAPGGKCLGKALINIIAENALRDEDLEKARYRGWDGAAKGALPQSH